MKRVVLLFIIGFFVSCNGERIPIQTAVYPKVGIKEKIEKGIPEDAVPTASSAFTQAIDRYFMQAVNNGQILGAAVAIVSQDGLVYQSGYGRRSAQSNVPIDEHTVFRIGSLSKSVTGVLMGTLVDQEILGWEDKVSERLPNFQLSDPDHARQITLRHLLSHSSGMPYHTYTNLVEAGLSLEEITKELDSVEDLQPLGQIFSYQNAVFALSGEMAQDASGQDMRTLLQKNLFEPLGMQDASADYTSIMAEENKAVPHKGGQGQWWPASINEKYYNAIGAGGINASISDMAEILYLMLGQRADVIEPATLEKITTPQIATRDKYRYYHKWDDHQESFYGMGWRIHHFDHPDGRDTLMHHGGYVNGFRSEIAISKKSGVGICVLFNNPNRFSRTVIPDLLEKYRKDQNSNPNPNSN